MWGNPSAARSGPQKEATEGRDYQPVEDRPLGFVNISTTSQSAMLRENFMWPDRKLKITNRGGHGIPAVSTDEVFNTLLEELCRATAGCRYFLLEILYRSGGN